MAAKKKQITFDIDTNVCKQIFGEDKFRQPYKDIRKFFKKNDCTHIEGSSYMSNHGMSNLALSNLIDDLLDQYPYLTKCIKKMHQADISNVHSLEHHFEYDGTPGKFKQQENQKAEEQETKPIKVTSLKDRIAQKKAVIEQRDLQYNSQHKNKSHGQEL